MTVARRQPVILVVEDNPTTSRSIELFLRDGGLAVRHASDGRGGLELARGESIDLILLDLMLPDLDGMEVCRRIRESSRVPIVMLTARSTEDAIVAGLEAGADDYVCKPFGGRELVARIRRCLRRSAEASAPAAGPLAVGDLRLDLARRKVTVGRTPVKLTRSEFDILALLMGSPGRVFTRDQIIAGALGRDFDGHDRTIDTHIWSLRRKLGEPRGAPRYIAAEQGVGYRLLEPES